MGKILLTNIKEYGIILNNLFLSKGFSASGEAQFGNNSVYTYSKLNFNNVNFLTVRDEDFVAFAGSLIYDGSVGNEALQKLAIDTLEKDVYEIRKKCFGSYVVAYKSNKQICVFVDELGCYALHYIKNDNGYVITNNSVHIEKCVKEKLNTYAFLERSLEYGIINNESYFMNIFRLLGDELICIDTCTNTISVNRVKLNNYVLSSQNYYDIVDEFADALKCSFAKMSAFDEYIKEGSFKQFCTGGIDSRLFLGLYLCNGIKPTIVNWQGQPILMNTKSQDGMIASELALATDSDYIKVSISSNRKFDISLFDKLGEYASAYGCISDFFKIFESGAVFDFGYCSEMIRPIGFLSKLSPKHISLRNFIYALLSKSGFYRSLKPSKYNEMIFEYIYSKYKEIATKNNLDVDALSETDCKFLLNHYRCMADTAMCNLSNAFGFSPALFGEKRLFDLSNQIPYEYVVNEKFIVSLIEKIQPKLLNIPVFSHCTCFHYRNGLLLKDKSLIDDNVFEMIESKKRIMRIRKKISTHKLLLEHQEIELLNTLESNYCLQFSEIYSLMEGLAYCME